MHALAVSILYHLDTVASLVLVLSRSHTTPTPAPPTPHITSISLFCTATGCRIRGYPSVLSMMRDMSHCSCGGHKSWLDQRIRCQPAKGSWGRTHEESWTLDSGTNARAYITRLEL